MELFFTQRTNHFFEGNKNPAVFLHGLWGGGNNLRHYDFSDLFLSPLYFPDELGFGKSPKPHLQYTPKAHVDAIVSLLPKEKKYTFLGNSFGAVLACYIAYYYPSLVDKLILISPLVYRDSREARKHLSKRFIARFTIRYPLLTHLSCILLCKTTLLSYIMPLFSDVKRKTYIRDCVLHGWNSYYSSFMECLVKRSVFQIINSLPNFINTLILYGEDDSYISIETIRDIKNPHTTVRGVSGGKHDILFEQFPTCLDIVQRWLMEKEMG